MRVKHALVRWFFLHALPVTVVAAPGAFLYVLARRQPHDWHDLLPWVFIVFHSAAIAERLGKFGSGHFGFLYTRGFARDALWFNNALAGALSVLAAWLPVALLLWLGIRSAFQDLLLNPYFPIMAPAEAPLPVLWMAGYAVLLPAFHYAMIRRAQPTRGRYGAMLLSAGLAFALLTMIIVRFRAVWFRHIAFAGGIIIAITVVVAGCLLHRRLEVHT